MTLCSQTGGELLEVWYYGELTRVEGEAQPFIADTEEAPGMVFARDARSGEEFLIFDGAKHGYDAMFCDEYDAEALASRTLKRNGMAVEAEEMANRVFSSESYHDALNIIGEFVNITSPGQDEGEEMCLRQ